MVYVTNNAWSAGARDYNAKIFCMFLHSGISKKITGVAYQFFAGNHE